MKSIVISIASGKASIVEAGDVKSCRAAYNSVIPSPGERVEMWGRLTGRMKGKTGAPGAPAKAKPAKKKAGKKGG